MPHPLTVSLRCLDPISVRARLRRVRPSGLYARRFLRVCLYRARSSLDLPYRSRLRQREGVRLQARATATGRAAVGQSGEYRRQTSRLVTGVTGSDFRVVGVDCKLLVFFLFFGTERCVPYSRAAVGHRSELKGRSKSDRRNNQYEQLSHRAAFESSREYHHEGTLYLLVKGYMQVCYA